MSRHQRDPGVRYLVFQTPDDAAQGQRLDRFAKREQKNRKRGFHAASLSQNVTHASQHDPHRRPSPPRLDSYRGPDWAPFLKGLCTAHVDDIVREQAAGAPSSLHYGAFLRPQGKMYADCLIQAVAADDIWLDVPLSARDELLAKLNMYRLRTKVTIEALDRPVFVAFGDALPDGFLQDPRSRVTQVPFGMAYSVQTAEANIGDWAVFRYSVGLADPGYDFDKDELYAIDANLDLLGAIDFKKGCYVGQELTSRMKRRGQIKNRILGLSHSGLLSKDAEILSGDLRTGEVLGSADGVSIGLMRLDRMDAGLTCDGVAVNVIKPDWIDFTVSTSV
ncbi:MAG: folate-binding protein [Asticcacaulis sp.]